MHDQTQDSAILLKLAQHIPEELLHEIFPDMDPDSIRESLRRSSGCTAPTPDPGAGPNSTAPDNRPERSPRLKEKAKSCMLYTDGASRGNPGEAGAGAVLLDTAGRELAVRSLYLGQCTNNVAEYQALIAGLELAGEFGCRKLQAFLDSELIVRQINGQYRVKNEQLKPLFGRVMNLLQQLEGWRIEHVPRSENARADELANRGIDQRK